MLVLPQQLSQGALHPRQAAGRLPAHQHHGGELRGAVAHRLPAHPHHLRERDAQVLPELQCGRTAQ